MLSSLSRLFGMRFAAGGAAFLLFIGLQIPRTAHALRIDADFVNLADVVPGQDLWQGSYRLSLGTFATNEGFTIYFDPLAYANLSAPLPPTPLGWDVLSIQPDPILSAPGFLDGLALVNNPTLTQPFSVNFVWHGTGQPGTQNFETYTLNGGFRITGTGQTVVSMVPEVGNGFGTGFALVAVAAFSALRRPSGLRRKAV